MKIKKLELEKIWTVLRIPLFSFLAAVAVVLVLLLLNSDRPFESLCSFFAVPFSASYYFGTWLNSAALLSFAAVGMCVSFRCSCFNLGGEGQIYLGGFIAAIMLNAFSGVQPFVALTATFLVTVLVSCAIGLLSGLLKIYRNINELLSSFLISSAILPLVDYAVSGPLRDSKGMLLATPFIDKTFRLKSILKPSALNVSFFVVILISVLTGLFLFFTRKGYQLRCTGKAPEFSEYCGFSTEKLYVSSMCFSSVMHGLSGFFAVIGTYYTCHEGFSAGMGWNALSIALIAKSNPFFVLPSALLLAYIITATDCAVLENSMSLNSTFLVQGVVLIVVSAQFIIEQKKERSRERN